MITKESVNHEENRNNFDRPVCTVPSEKPVNLTQHDILTPGGVGMTGEEVKRLRIRQCITQKQLGEMLGYTGKAAETVVQKWEYGERPIPTKHWKALCKIFKVKLDAFLPE